ncbi:hypothetical protein, partial [Poseidonibacter sp.]|uniref:hypothetical protein n=1 Tax=Poseidonibacter sp. TaxID=2321188 RepID=UPI003C75ADFA
LVNDFEDSTEIDFAFDINTIFEKRKSRTASFENDDIDFIREKTAIDIIYINQILENEYLRLTILNDIYGLNIYLNHVKDDECINYFEKQHIELLSSEIFHSANIEKLLDNEYRLKLINECKRKLLVSLEQIEV